MKTGYIAVLLLLSATTAAADTKWYSYEEIKKSRGMLPKESPGVEALFMVSAFVCVYRWLKRY